MEAVIRAGGRSTVYTARKRGEGELRALKLVAIGDSSDRTIADAERRGAELQQEFARHHGLVPFVEEIAETRSCLYVVMEYVPGEDLFDALARGPLPWQRALDIAIELATFLEKTHRFDVTGRAPERIIHADLKPGNVRIRPDGHICVLDFGIAKAMAERRLETTQKWGTRQDMSPEWLQTGTIDEQVDYWSVGVLLYEMLAGYRPYRRFERHDNQLEDAIRRREPIEPLPLHAAGPALREVISRLLAPELRQRYASAGEIRAALEACRRDVPTLPVMEPAASAAPPSWRFRSRVVKMCRRSRRRPRARRMPMARFRSCSIRRRPSHAAARATLPRPARTRSPEPVRSAFRPSACRCRAWSARSCRCRRRHRFRRPRCTCRSRRPERSRWGASRLEACRSELPRSEVC